MAVAEGLGGRRAESKNRNSAIGLWTAAIFVNGIVFTVAAAIVPKLWRTSNPAVFFPLVFCIVGVILAVAAIRASIRRKRFGQTYFEFASLPFSPGRSLKGTIHLRFNTDARHGIDLSLSCVRQVTTAMVKIVPSRRAFFGKRTRMCRRQSLTPGPMGDAAIPVEFSIPSDAYESCHDQPDDQVLWLLHAQADVPGVNYSDDFEVPVFRLTPSPSSAQSRRLPFRSRRAESLPRPSSPMPPTWPLRRTKVVFPPGRTAAPNSTFPPFATRARFWF